MVLVLLCFEPFVQNCDAGFRDFVSLRYFLATLLMLEFARWIQVSAKGGRFLFFVVLPAYGISNIAVLLFLLKFTI